MVVRLDFLDADRARMLTLPPVAPVVRSVTTVRLGRDYYVRVAGNDYSVDPSAIGQLVEVTHHPDPGDGEPSRAPAGGRMTAAGLRDKPSPTPSTLRLLRRCATNSKPAPADGG